MMSGRFASVVVCDDLYFSINGKWNVVGVYTGDLVIPQPEAPVPQLVFVFMVETDVDDPFRSLRLEVTLPEGKPTSLDIPIAQTPQELAPGRTKFLVRVPLVVSQPILFPGRISAKVVHERGEMTVIAPWITLANTATPGSSA